MIYNDKIVSEYGGITINELCGDTPIPFRPIPLAKDYDTGWITRSFAKKTNEDKITEIDLGNSSNLNRVMYQVVSLSWKISGPRDKKIINGIIENFGVVEGNTLEIDRVKKEFGVDLSRALPNLTEYWRGF